MNQKLVAVLNKIVGSDITLKVYDFDGNKVISEENAEKDGAFLTREELLEGYTE